MEMADKDASLAKFRGVMPSRAALAQLSLFGTTEETRQSAQAILELLPEMTEKERGEYMTETWMLANTLTEEDMGKSPAGRATLELIRNCKPMSGEINAAPESPATDAQVTNASSPAIEPDDTNPHLRQLNWPPKASPPPKAPEDDGQRHLWQAAQPSK